jgi:hypothetical protein
MSHGSQTEIASSETVYLRVLGDSGHDTQMMWTASNDLLSADGQSYWDHYIMNNAVVKTKTGSRLCNEGCQIMYRLEAYCARNTVIMHALLMKISNKRHLLLVSWLQDASA